MNAKLTIVTSLIALAGAGSAFAQEATADQFAQQVVSQKSRAEVQAEAQRGPKLGGTWMYNDIVSTRSRAEVNAEARAAQHLGLIGYGEGPTRVATAVEQAAIQNAGQRVAAPVVAANAR